MKVLVEASDLQGLRKWVCDNVLTGHGMPLVKEIDRMFREGALTPKQEQSLYELMNQGQDEEDGKEE